MAKILARSLNCVNGPTATPCGECESCLTIAGGTSLDVIEMDAASNRSVDDIRELRDRVGYAPAAGHWKVYILDEAHMLTKEAWNAFLKTLEEPPPNTAFVLATTEPQKVMATIVDRCQRFDFHRPSLDQISEVIQRAAKSEGIEVDDGAVALISRSASGSFRDALGTLDQLVSYGSDGVTTDDVLTMLGAADADLIFKTVDAVGAGDAKGALGAVDELVRSGRDPAQFARDLVSHLRQLIVVGTTGEIPDSFSVTVSEPDRLREQAAHVPEASVMAAIDSLSLALANIREGDDARLSVEVALLKVARPSLDTSKEALLRRIERLEGAAEGSAGAGASTAGPTQLADEGSDVDQGGQGPSAPAPAPAKPKPPQASADGAEPTPPQPEADGAQAGSAGAAFRGPGNPSPEDGPAGQNARPADGGAPPPRPATTPDPAPTSTIDLDKVMGLWPAVLDNVRESGAAMLSSVFEGTKLLAVDSEKSELKIGFPPSATFNKRKAEAKANVERLAESLRETLGERLRPVYELLDGDAEPEQAKDEASVSEEELVELLKTKFDAHEVVDEEKKSAEG
jgi:DNA polymerase-3 subunit gamma/tau